MDPYNLYNKEEGTFFEANCGHKNRGCLEYFLLHKGSYSYVRTIFIWHVFRGYVQQRRVVQQYGFGTDF
jgi:hypothetical protein